MASCHFDVLTPLLKKRYTAGLISIHNLIIKEQIIHLTLFNESLNMHI